jgi:citrate lyase subunit beta/citryl-CoA lyase
MWSIHPNQIVPIVEAMRPDFSEVQTCRNPDLRPRQGLGPNQHEGKLHDRASYRYYWELLERAHITGMEIPSEAKSRFFA